MSGTPIVIDGFSRIMADLFDEKEVISVSTAGQSFFGRPENGANTIFSPDSNLVEIDIIRGNRQTAALVPRGTISRLLGDTQQNMNAEKFTNFARKYPLSAEVGDINANQLLMRMAGENPYDVRTRLDSMRLLALKYNNENIRRHVRLFEVLAWQSLRTGVQDAILGTSDTDLQYDFRRDATNTITVTNAWGSGSQTIMADIDGACEKVRVNGKINPDIGIIGSSAMDLFIKDTDVQALADNRRFELMAVTADNPVPANMQRFVDAGLQPRGKLSTPAGFVLWLFTYLDSYENSSGTDTKYMPVDEMLILSSKARFDRYFGPPERLPMIQTDVAEYQELFGVNPLATLIPMNIKSPGNVIEANMFYTDAYRSTDRSKVSIRTQSAPIFPTTQTDAVALLDGLV